MESPPVIVVSGLERLRCIKAGLSNGERSHKLDNGVRRDVVDYRGQGANDRSLVGDFGQWTCWHKFL
jgi:hypothetical protein